MQVGTVLKVDGPHAAVYFPETDAGVGSPSEGNPPSSQMWEKRYEHYLYIYAIII